MIPSDIADDGIAACVLMCFAVACVHAQTHLFGSSDSRSHARSSDGRGDE